MAKEVKVIYRWIMCDSGMMSEGISHWYEDRHGLSVPELLEKMGIGW